MSRENYPGEPEVTGVGSLKRLSHIRERIFSKTFEARLKMDQVKRLEYLLEQTQQVAEILDLLLELRVI